MENLFSGPSFFNQCYFFQIAVEKDWIVVIADNDNDQLAKMNSVFRTIDLLCLLISPSLAGLIFDYLSYAWAAIFIANWNILSVIVEYYLLYAIYQEYPALSVKNGFEESENPRSNNAVNGAANSTKRWSLSSILRSAWVSIVSSFQAWISYMKHSVRNAGLGLAFLYMTVLGFDNITWGYCLSQCVSTALLGGMVGVSAIFGVAGSLTFPLFRRKFGLNCTGVIGTVCQIVALSLCVISIWLPGSPFGVTNFNQTRPAFENSTKQVEVTSLPPVEPFNANETRIAYVDEFGRGESEAVSCFVSSFISVAIFLSGIIAARFGLWLIDLTITQILQEKVEEQKRGVINGVQVTSSLFFSTCLTFFFALHYQDFVSNLWLSSPEVLGFTFI